MVHDLAPHLRQRHLRFRPEHEGQSRRLRRHHRPQLQTAERRPRLRLKPLGAYVADDPVAEPVFVMADQRNVLSSPSPGGGGSIAAAERRRSGWGDYRKITLTRLASLADLPPPGGGEGREK